MSFTHDFRDQLQAVLGKRQIMANPLVTIGLTESILNLGLTEDQLYRIVRSYVRQLVAQIHPDRTGRAEATADEKAIIEALNILDDQKKFSEALAEFKTLKAEDRREIRILRQGHEALRRRLQETEDYAKSVPKLREELEKEREAFILEKAKEPLLVPELTERLRNVYQGQERLRKDLDKAVSKVRYLNIFLEHYRRYLAGLACGSIPTETGSHATSIFKCSVVAVFTLRHSPMVPLPFGENAEATKAFVAAANRAGISKRQRRIIEANLREAVKISPIPPPGKSLPRKSSLYPSIEIYQVAYSKIKEVVYPQEWPESFREKRIIGSVGPGSFELTRESLHKGLPQEKVMQQCLPFLEPRGLMVLARGKSFFEATKGDQLRFHVRATLVAGIKRPQTTKFILYAA